MTPAALHDLRAHLVEQLRARGDIRTAAVAAAFARVPRHVFLPSVPADEAYADRSIAIKLEDGVPISSSSQPAIMAEMLEMLGLRKGDRVLEIGAGSGYNAALLAELVGDSGLVVTIDIDADLAAGAQQRLDGAGYARVRVLCRDGALGDPEDAPFDAMIASVGVERVPPAWVAQLRVGGRFVTPLTIRSIQKVVAFERTADGLESRSAVDAAFMMLRGTWASSDTRVIELGEPTLTVRVLDAHAARVGSAAVTAALEGPRFDAPTARRIAPDEAWIGVALWLALADDAFCRLTAVGPSVVRDVVPNLGPDAAAFGVASTFGLCDAEELVVFARRGRDVTLRRFGPHTGTLARAQSAIKAWHAAGRPGNGQLRISIAADGAMRAALARA